MAGRYKMPMHKSWGSICMDEATSPMVEHAALFFTIAL